MGRLKKRKRKCDGWHLQSDKFFVKCPESRHMTFWVNCPPHEHLYEDDCVESVLDQNCVPFYSLTYFFHSNRTHCQYERIYGRSRFVTDFFSPIWHFNLFTILNRCNECPFDSTGELSSHNLPIGLERWYRESLAIIVAFMNYSIHTGDEVVT